MWKYAHRQYLRKLKDQLRIGNRVKCIEPVLKLETQKIKKLWFII